MRVLSSAAEPASVNDDVGFLLFRTMGVSSAADEPANDIGFLYFRTMGVSSMVIAAEPTKALVVN